MDLAKIREDFPILSREVHGKPLVYLDSAATSQKPRSVIEAESRFYEVTNANVHRGVYALSEEATDAYEAARARVARMLNARDPAEVVFVRGTTEAINQLATGLARGSLEKGDRIVTTVMEHHSNIVPWHMLRSTHGVDLQFVGVDDGGRLNLSDYDTLLTRKTRLAALSQVSNVLGTVNPVREVAEKAHDVGAIALLDAAQSIPHRKVDVQALGVDFLAFSGHKCLAPTGIGVLWGRRELLEKLPPALGGGEMIKEVHTDRVSYREPPYRFEAGTPNIAGAVGLAAALNYLEGIGWDELRAHSVQLFRRWVEQSRAVFDGRLRTFGPEEVRDREPILSFAIDRIHPHDVASLLDADGIAVRSGHHCAQPLMERFGVPALTRASPYLYNTLDEVDRLVESLVRAERRLAG